MSDHQSPEIGVVRLQEELDLSRRELADARVRLELALEEAAAERARREQAEAALAAAPDEDSGSHPERPAVLGRLADRLRRQTK